MHATRVHRDSRLGDTAQINPQSLTMQVSTFMTANPITIDCDSSVQEALRWMDDLNVRHLPVIGDGKLVGVLSNRDLLEARKGTVRDVMCAEVATIAPEDTVVSVCTEVVQRGISCMPVVENAALVGIVTEFDLMKAFVRACDEGKLAGDIDPPIRQLMSSKVMGIEVTDRLLDAEAALAALNVHHAPVLRDGSLVGFLSDRDLRRAKGLGLPPESSVQEVMTTDVRTLKSSDPLSAAAKEMIEFRFSALPIVDVQLVGILSSRDVLDHCMNTLRVE